MTKDKLVFQIQPWNAKHPDCPFDCVDCEHNLGVSMQGKRVYVTCNLENN